MPAPKLTTNDYRKRRIKAAMAAKGLTGRAAAKKLNMSDARFSFAISHISDMRLRDVELICSAIGLQVKDLLEVSA
ncbi:hypothetical protein [Ruminococcus sp.]|uniref:hypothetical protein n=1 Tax=Ruminococcus sp. TaxID=41978 RepID=UPI0025D1B3F7|nr:hypothetical protein [Ruminococcus sp.]MBQ8968035.1 hypothetical protein [Ruminococcus sp.]